MQADALPELPQTARKLLRYWKTARGPHVLPHRSAIEPIHLREWLSDLSIIEVRNGPKRFFVRLHGAGTTENLGQDFSRQFLEDCTDGAATEIALQPYLTSIETLMPTFSSVEPEPLSGVFSSLDRLVLPFTDVDQTDAEAPVSIDRFLTWVGPTDLLRGEDSAVYRATLPAKATNGATPHPIRLSVIDVDDPRYGLDSASRSSTPMAARRPVAKQA